MLMYDTKDLILIGYTNSYFQIDIDSRKLTSGSVFTLNGGATIWRSIKQGCIVDSTMEAEYVAACEATKESVWLRKFLTDLEVVPICIYLSLFSVIAVEQLQILKNQEAISEENILSANIIS